MRCTSHGPAVHSAANRTTTGYRDHDYLPSTTTHNGTSTISTLSGETPQRISVTTFLHAITRSSIRDLGSLRGQATARSPLAPGGRAFSSLRSQRRRPGRVGSTYASASGPSVAE